MKKNNQFHYVIVFLMAVYSLISAFTEISYFLEIHVVIQKYLELCLVTSVQQIQHIHIMTLLLR